MPFDQFEQQRREQAEREAQNRQERLQASREAAVGVQAERAALAAGFVKNAQYPPDTKLVQRHTTYSRETVRKGWGLFARSYGGIVAHYEINLRANGWDLGTISQAMLPSGRPAHWYLDVTGGLWFEISSYLGVQGAPYDPHRTFTYTAQQQQLKYRLSNTRETGDVPHTTIRKEAGGPTYPVTETMYARMDFDELHKRFADTSHSVSITSGGLFSDSPFFEHLFTALEGYSMNVKMEHSTFKWGPWRGMTQDSDWLHDHPYEDEHPLIKSIYERSLKKGIIA